MERVGEGEKVTYLVFFEETEFLALFGLGTLFMVASLDGITHGGHGGRVCVVCSGGRMLYLNSIDLGIN